VLAIPPATLAAWTRVAPPVERSPETWRHAASDGRRAWALVLVLLAIETIVRRRATTRPGVHAHAA